MTDTDYEPCCPKFDPTGWKDAMLEWQDRRFIKGTVKTFMLMPVNYGKVVKELEQKIKAAGGTVPDNLVLSDHTSKTNMDVYVATDREVPGADNYTLNGRFFSSVYEGAFEDTGNWVKDFTDKVDSRGMTTKKMFMWYTTCPKCATFYGENYVVAVAEV
ncbi:MAG: hypothetical protein CVT60_02720 [Actinobacteria bacterium HGW-Actinobacteria-10]|nr:MAG: hypothetical protein CVT60_02720 [Actinobacteria bacterium HGW-Actinobacteria-10]